MDSKPSTKLAFQSISLAIWLAILILTISVIGITVSIPFWLIVLIAVAIWAPYYVFSPFVFWLSNKFPFSKKLWKRTLLVHLAGSILFVTASEGTFLLLVVSFQPQVITYLQESNSMPQGRLVEPPSSDFNEIEGRANNRYSQYNFIFFRAQTSFPLYWIMVAISNVIAVLGKLRAREQQAIELKTKLARAELVQLRAQLQPHFLFNTLNSIVALVESDASAAKEMILDLSDLLRILLKQSEIDLIPISQELEILSYYERIQKTRFREKVTFEYRIDGATLKTLVPPLLLQPLVENAIHHGVETTGKQGKIILSTKLLENGSTEIILENHALEKMHKKKDHIIHDDQSALSQGGLGLSNTRARLEALYGDECVFKFGWQTAGNYQVLIVIPSDLKSQTISFK